MTTTISSDATTERTDWTAVARRLGPAFASRAPALDANDSFGAENFRELKENRVFSAGIPAELGGGGASHSELCAMLRELGRYCGATALSLSMHTHLIATSVWQYRQGMPVAPMLQRVAAEDLYLVTSSASDWLESSGVAERVEGGYRVSVRKHFVSGSPAGDILVTSAIYDDPSEGPTVLHFSTPMRTEGIAVMDNWRTMAMRPSGSNDVVLDQVFVPDAAIASRRGKGAWAPMFNVVGPVALPLIMSVYLGVAEAAHDIAVEQAAKKREDANVWYLAGEMENALAAGRLAVEGLRALCADYDFAPEIDRLNQALVYKTIAAESLERAVAKALEAAGGGGIFRGMGLERLFRDIQAAQFHPLQTKRQHRFTGRLVLGLEPVG